MIPASLKKGDNSINRRHYYQNQVNVLYYIVKVNNWSFLVRFYQFDLLDLHLSEYCNRLSTVLSVQVA